MSIQITELIYYPVKSLSGISVSELELDDFGPKWDRRFMYVDAAGVFISQRRFPQLSKLAVSITATGLCISGVNSKLLTYKLDNFKQALQVRVWQDQVKALASVEVAEDQLMSDFLSEPVRLVYMPDNSFRQLDREFYAPDKRVGFADAFPLLLTNEGSVTELNERLAPQHAVQMARFRANVVVRAERPYQEDEWRRLRLGDIECVSVKPCSRCSMTTIDSQGRFGKEPLKTLSTYRRNQYGVCFGHNLVHLKSGFIRVGDYLTVLDVG